MRDQQLAWLKTTCMLMLATIAGNLFFHNCGTSPNADQQPLVEKNILSCAWSNPTKGIERANKYVHQTARLQRRPSVLDITDPSLTRRFRRAKCLYYITWVGSSCLVFHFNKARKTCRLNWVLLKLMWHSPFTWKRTSDLERFIFSTACNGTGNSDGNSIDMGNLQWIQLRHALKHIWLMASVSTIKRLCWQFLNYTLYKPKLGAASFLA